MRCIEIMQLYPYNIQIYLININMRCIEIVRRELKTLTMNEININMRCIEMQMNHSILLTKFRLTLT